MSLRMLASGAAALAVAASTVALAQPSAQAAAVPQGTPITKVLDWRAGHGDATAAGTRWLEQGTAPYDRPLVVKGELRNTGTGCSSVWIAWQRDFVSYPPEKQATQCGPGAAPIAYRKSAPGTLSSATLFVCRGERDTQDCGDRVLMTNWGLG
ncbi:hypothetical protein [Streptomyces sp. TLI_146]|uniref:hypothetical protein n=1 Tax=Streptomyces sp. TLI_146 TaxID=1938858 RepID=UPI000CBC3228|nr:hypothetical protein [Streptomyces sp. TLI_146]PKV89310.1 hypothetical protein BX283_6946 [Streptomyces sp. TLI_146]